MPNAGAGSARPHLRHHRGRRLPERIVQRAGRSPQSVGVSLGSGASFRLAKCSLARFIAVARSRFRRLLAESTNRAALIDTHEQMDRLAADLQGLVLKIRMLPLGPLFQQFRRTARDIARGAARVMGDVTIVGIAGGNVALSFYTQPLEVSIQTTYWGSRPELVELFNLAGRGLVRTELTTYSLDDAVQAYHDLHGGQVRGRAVIVP